MFCFVLFYSHKPRSQVGILIYRKWSIPVFDLTQVALFFGRLLSLLIFWAALFPFRGRYGSRVQGLGLRTQDSDPPWPAQEHHQSAGSLHTGKATDGDHGVCPSWQLVVFSAIKEGHLRTRLDQDNKWSGERVHISWSGDDRLSSQSRYGIPGFQEGK